MRWTLKQTLEQYGITPHKLAMESGLSTATVYPMARGTAERVSLETLQTVADTLMRLVGKPISITDIFDLELTAEEK
jgi:transcriptional regulator with XRE-family HTH domain